jgi:predicted SprT family Zn-dependent metalloprotease
MGQFHWKYKTDYKRRNLANGGYVVESVRTEIPQKIRISRYYDLTQRDIEEILIHEMIHYYLCYTGCTEKNKHGHSFQKLSREITRKSNYRITVKYEGEFGKITRKTDKVYYYVTFKANGKEYFSRVSKPFMDRLRKEGFGNKVVTNLEFFQTKDIVMDKYRQMTSRLSTISVACLPIKHKIKVK